MAEFNKAKRDDEKSVSCPVNGASVPQSFTVCWTVGFKSGSYYFVIHYADGTTECFGPYLITGDRNSTQLPASRATPTNTTADLYVYRVPDGTQVDCSTVETERDPESIISNLIIGAGGATDCACPDEDTVGGGSSKSSPM